MISVFKKGTPQIIGGLGDGTRTSPWYWYAKTSGQTVAVNNSNASSGDNYRVYLRVKLKGGTTYTIGQTSVGGDGDGMIWLYNSAMSEVANDDHSYGDIAGLEVQDVMTYTPSADGVYIIGAGAYDSDKGAFTVAMSPAPEQETLPNVEYRYPTSSGFNALGRPLKYRSAAEAGCGIIRLMPEDGLVFYAALSSSRSAAETGQSWSISGTVNYKTVDGIPCAEFTGSQCIKSTQMTGFPAGASPRTLSTWIRSTAYEQDSYTFSYGGEPKSGYFGLDIDHDTAYIATSGNSNTLKCPIDENKWYHFAAAYDGELLHFYCNGGLFGSAAFPNPVLNTVLDYVNIGAGYSGNRNQFKGYIAACRLYNRVLAPTEVKMLSKEFKI